VLEAGTELTGKAGGNWIKLDPSGIHMGGGTIHLGGGGSPGGGSGATPQAPNKAISVDEAGKPVQTRDQRNSNAGDDATAAGSGRTANAATKDGRLTTIQPICFRVHNHKYTKAINDARASATKLTSGNSAAAKRWQALAKKIPGSTTSTLLDKLSATDKFVNIYKYQLDIDRYGKKDYWAPPEEFLDGDLLKKWPGGDCEDSALMKYTLLEQAGVDAATMKIVTVKTSFPPPDDYHAVLSVTDPQTGKIYILDNMNTSVPLQDYNPDYGPTAAYSKEAVCVYPKK
jgi:predicted transglutaminase-like cysteine proteinase